MKTIALGVTILFALPVLAADRSAPAPTQVLRLAQAVETARKNQPQLQQAHAGSDAAAARADEARAPLLPQLSASASYERGTNNVARKPGIPSVSGLGKTSWDSSNYYNFGATLSQLVYDFGQSTGRYSAAKASAQAQRDSESYSLVQVLLGVRTAYFNARAARDLVGVARDTFANQQAHLRQIEGFVEVGTRPAIDLAQARTAVANAQVQLITAENGYQTTKAQLNQAMGVEGPTDYEVGDETLPPVAGEDQTLDALLPEALKNRPDVAAFGEQIRAQELTTGSLKGGYLPALGVSAEMNNAGAALDSTVNNWSLQATLTWNIFQGGLTSAQVRESQANLRALQAQAAALQQQVRLDVEQARLAVRASTAALAAAEEAVANAREQLRLAEGRYQAGNGSVIELGDAQVAYTTAAAQRVQAEYNLSISRAQLLRALGRVDAATI